MKPVSRADFFGYLLALAAVSGVVLLRISTRWGAGVGGDATIYLTSARNLLDGIGLGLVTADGTFRLLPYFPPFFPLVLSALGWLGLDLLFVAHWLNMLLFADLIGMVGFTTFGLTGSRRWGAAAALLVLLSPVLIPVYSWAMAEPLAIGLGFCGLLLVLGYLERGGNKRMLVAAALVGGLGVLTRYANAAFLATGGLALLLFSSQGFRKRMLDLLLYGVVGAAPVISWVVYDFSHTATVASRSLESGVTARLAALIPALGEVFLFWFIPDSWIDRLPAPTKPAALLLVLVALGMWTILVTRKRPMPVDREVSSERLRRFIVLLALFIVVYLGLIALVYLTTFPPITIASRMLSPLHVAALWLVALLASLTVPSRQSSVWVNRILLLAFGLFIVWSGWRSARILQQNYESGIGFTSIAWQQSLTVAAVQGLSVDNLLVTNEEMALLFLTGRTAYPLAEIYFDQPLDVFTRYGDGDLTGDDAQRLFGEGEAVLVLFDSIEEQLAGLYGDSTSLRISRLINGLEALGRYPDGSLYRYPQP